MKRGERRDEVERHAGRRRDAHHASGRRVTALGGAEQLAGPLRHAPRRLEPALAMTGQRGALHAAIEQRITEPLFELGQTPTHRGLTNTQVAGGLGQAAVVSDRQKQPHVVPANIHFRMVTSNLSQFSSEFGLLRFSS